MPKEWSELSADEKRGERFKRWLSPKNINFISQEAEQLYRVRVQRFIDAINLKEPDRVPAVGAASAARYAGYTIKEVMYDVDKLIKASEKYMNDFEFDVIPASMVQCGKALDLIDSKMVKWAGHGLPDDSEFQFCESDFLKANEWDHFISDPSDFHIRKYLPRTCGAAKSFCKLPPLSTIDEHTGGFLAFADPEILNAFKVLGEAGKANAEWFQKLSVVFRKGMEKGLPSLLGHIGTGLGAPLDAISAALRGSSGTIIDMYRQPEKLLEYMEKAVPRTIESIKMAAQMLNVPAVMIPMHRGADGFMSEKQFLTFYWPFLKKVVMGYIEEGLVPVLFAEGSYNTRLEIIKDEFPNGKVIWYFDHTDIAMAKKTLGDKCCLMGNIPVSLMCTGSPDEIKKYCRKLIETAGVDGGYILAPGAFADQTKVENVNAMMEAAKEYGVYMK